MKGFPEKKKKNVFFFFWQKMAVDSPQRMRKELRNSFEFVISSLLLFIFTRRPYFLETMRTIFQ